MTRGRPLSQRLRDTNKKVPGRRDAGPRRLDRIANSGLEVEAAARALSLVVFGSFRMAADDRLRMIDAAIHLDAAMDLDLDQALALDRVTASHQHRNLPMGDDR